MYDRDDAETIEYKGYTIHICYDTDPASPREWDNLGTMVCSHRHYNLGDEQMSRDDSFVEWAARHLGLEEEFNYDYGKPSKYYDNEELILAKFHKENLVIPIMAYEHGGITIRAYDYGNFPDQRWDCGQLGFIYVSKDKVKAEYGNAGKRNMEKARKCLLQEIKTYDDYLTGDVYGYVIDGPEEERIDSCWGYYGEIAEIVAEAKSIVDSEVKDAQEKQYLAQPYLTGMEA